jgi:ribosomal protein S18 acetylase RimI-like enzyme
MNEPAKPSSIVVTIASEATSEVASAIARLIPGLSRSAAPPTLHELRDIIQSQANTLLLARDRENDYLLVGMLSLITFRIPTGIRAWIEDVIVDSGARGRGIGELLTREALRIAAEKGAKTVDLTSRQSRVAAHRLYERVGFVHRDTRVYRYTMPTDPT